jgi:uncharacterized glyoxalase superfamily protein PhnB
MDTPPRPVGLTPYLFYDDAAALLDWYARVFGWVEIGRWPGPDGRVQNAEMAVAGGELWLDGGGWRWFDAAGERVPVWTGVWVDDVDAVYGQVRAAGVDCEPPVTRDFGIRMLTVTDPAGYQWGFQQRV